MSFKTPQVKHTGIAVKRLFLLGLVVGVAAGCAASKSATSKTRPASQTASEPATSPAAILDETEALQIAKRFAEQKRWEIRRSPTQAKFDVARGEWQIFFDIKDRGGPFIVYVNNVTGVPRHIIGE